MKNYVVETIRKTIEDNMLISRGDHVVLGLSGGPDSMCLFSALMELSDKAGFTLEAVHVNHKFRPGAAEEDQAYVEEVCRKAGIRCTSVAVDCALKAEEEGISPEDAGRRVRYEAFDRAAARHGGSVKIAVAQNMDDQCETMLFRLIRGTGPDGLAGIRYVRKSAGGFDVIRPLLDVDRAHIEEYCEEMNLKPRIDHTNAETEYTRNKIRHELIPYIEENFNPNFKGALIRLSSSLSDDREMLEGITGETLEELVSEGCLDIEGLNSLEEGMKRRVLKEFLAERGLSEDVSMVHIDALSELCRKNVTSKRCELPRGYFAEISYGKLAVKGEGEEAADETEQKKVSAVFSKSALLEAFGTCEYEIRTRRPGDYIRLKSGRKKLKELFIDMKVPKDRRDETKVVAVGSEIIWIPGLRYSALYRGEINSGDALVVDIFVNI